jgi:Domain of unknown function (DU1801)
MPSAVQSFLTALVHPLTPTLSAVRTTMLIASPEVSEGIKWNAPSFYVGAERYFATANIPAPGKAGETVLAVLHRGAKAKSGRVKVEDPEGLIEWLSPDRGVMRFGSPAEVRAKRPAITVIVRQWIRQLVLVLAVLGCERQEPAAVGGPAAVIAATERSPVVVADSFAGVPDSVWIDVKGPTMVGFFRPATNAELERDGGLAALLDQFAYNLGIATDSLQAHGFAVTMQAGDTLWLRTTARRWRFVRDADSSTVGFYVTSVDGRQQVRYGPAAEFSLVEYADAFLRGPP